MNAKELRLLNLLCARLGIETVKDLEAFKRQYKADTNQVLLDRLAMYSIAKYKRVFNPLFVSFCRLFKYK